MQPQPLLILWDEICLYVHDINFISQENRARQSTAIASFSNIKPGRCLRQKDRRGVRFLFCLPVLVVMIHQIGSLLHEIARSSKLLALKCHFGLLCRLICWSLWWIGKYDSRATNCNWVMRVFSWNLFFFRQKIKIKINININIKIKTRFQK